MKSNEDWNRIICNNVTVETKKFNKSFGALLKCIEENCKSTNKSLVKKII